MKLPIIKKIQKEDLQTGEKVPGYIDRILSPLNQFIEQVAIAITGKLTIGDNVAGKYIDETFTHNVAKELNVNDTRAVGAVVPVYCANDLIVGYGWERLTNGNIQITLLFNSGGTSSRSTRLMVLFK